MILDDNRFQFVGGNVAFLSGVIQGLSNALLVEAGDRQEDIIADVFEIQDGPDGFLRSFQNRMHQYLQAVDDLSPEKRKELSSNVNLIRFDLIKEDCSDIVVYMIHKFGWAHTDAVQTKIRQFFSLAECYLQQSAGVYRIAGESLCDAVPELSYGMIPIGEMLIQYPGYMVMISCVAD